MDDESRVALIAARVAASTERDHFQDDIPYLLDRLRTAEAERDSAFEAVDEATARVVAAHKYGAAVEEARDEAQARAAEAEAVIAEALTGLRTSGEPDWPGWNVVEGVERILSRYRAGAEL